MTKESERKLILSNPSPFKKKINGLFAFFDILGFKEIIKNNDLEYLENIIANLLDTLDAKAVTIGGADTDQNLSLGKTESIVFSDTIILYEDMYQKSDGTILYHGPSLIDKSSILLRLAFDAGIPLRGAISFGPYIISNKYFLGQPIIDACIDEKKCNWSGAILCDSAVEAMKKQDYRPIDWMGINVRPFNPFTSELIIKFPANSTSFTNPDSLFKSNSDPLKVFFALRWDDLIKERYLLKDNPDLSLESREQIETRIREMFYSHNKGPRDDSEKNVVEEKILNTVDFTLGCRDIPIEPTLVYKP